MSNFDVSSRYQLDSSGITASPKDKLPVLYSLHRVVQGDTILNIAARLLNDDKLWWQIADINPQVKYPEDLVVGSLIRIPRQ